MNNPVLSSKIPPLSSTESQDSIGTKTVITSEISTVLYWTTGIWKVSGIYRFHFMYKFSEHLGNGCYSILPSMTNSTKWETSCGTSSDEDFLELTTLVKIQVLKADEVPGDKLYYICSLFSKWNCFLHIRDLPGSRAPSTFVHHVVKPDRPRVRSPDLHHGRGLWCKFPSYCSANTPCLT